MSRFIRCSVNGAMSRFDRMAGFTLFELIVALTLIVIIASIAVPQLISPTSPAQLSEYAERIGAALQTARETALAQSRDIIFSVDVKHRRMGIGERDGLRVPEDVQLTLYTARNEIAKGSIGHIRFFPDGSSTGGRITLNEPKTHDIRNISVNWYTGRVSISEK